MFALLRTTNVGAHPAVGSPDEMLPAEAPLMVNVADEPSALMSILRRYHVAALAVIPVACSVGEPPTETPRSHSVLVFLSYLK